MYQAAQNRYNTLPTRRCGNSGLLRCFAGAVA